MIFSFADENDMLGALLLLGVVLNIAIAQRHDEDAIAAQATLILLIVGSAAGAVYGEFGVAIMIGIGTILLHGLGLSEILATSQAWVLQSHIYGSVCMQSRTIGISSA